MKIEITKQDIAINAIREMFFHRQYKGVVPTKDIEVVKNSSHWHKVYGKKEVKAAIKALIEDKYINLDNKKENWLWGGDLHEMLFGDN